MTTAYISNVISNREQDITTNENLSTSELQQHNIIEKIDPIVTTPTNDVLIYNDLTQNSHQYPDVQQIDYDVDMLKDFLNVLALTKQEHLKKVKDYNSLLKWLDVKSYILSLNKTSFFGVTMVLTSLIIPSLSILGLIGFFILFRTTMSTHSAKHQAFQKNYHEIKQHELSKFPPPELLPNWLDTFSEFKFKKHNDAIETLLLLTEHIPDHPILIAFSKAYRGSQKGININYTYAETYKMLRDAQEHLMMLKRMKELKNEIVVFKTKNPEINLPQIPSSILEDYLSDGKTDNYISLDYKNIRTMFDLLNKYNQDVQNLGKSIFNLHHKNT